MSDERQVDDDQEKRKGLVQHRHPSTLLARCQSRI